MLFSREQPQMVASEDALAGRDEVMATEPHYVLGGSITPPWPEGARAAVFGMGCFWGAERIFWQLPGVITTAAGYAGGYTPHPTYQEVCTGQTGHAEAVLVVYDPAEVSYDELLKAFWENHDPTQQMRQGNDVGTQYRSAILVGDDAQRAAAEASRDRYQASLHDQGYGDIATQILSVSIPPTTPSDPGGGFYYAEIPHQQYLAKNPGGYCNHGFCQVAYT